MRSLIILPDDSPIEVDISEDLQNELITNAEYFKFNNMMPMFRNIFGNTYDVVTYFRHSSGIKYAVIHSIFGDDYENIFKEKIKTCKWTVTVSQVKTKRDCIKEYIHRNNCNNEYAYCIMDI